MERSTQRSEQDTNERQRRALVAVAGTVETGRHAPAPSGSCTSPHTPAARPYPAVERRALSPTPHTNTARLHYETLSLSPMLPYITRLTEACKEKKRNQIYCTLGSYNFQDQMRQTYFKENNRTDVIERRFRNNHDWKQNFVPPHI